MALRDRAKDPPATSIDRTRPRIGTTECLVVLVALDALFAAFVVIQAAYLFGGLDTLATTGMTYAEYARRGFFELLAVAFLVAGLILGLEALVTRRSRAYVVAAIVLVGLTIVVLGSSLLRLRLYQEAYGWTELRFYVLAAIGWLAIGALAGIAALATNRTRWLLHFMVVLSVVFGIGFNLIGPVQFIAEQNVARAVDPSLVPPGGETGPGRVLPLLAGHRCRHRHGRGTAAAARAGTRRGGRRPRRFRASPWPSSHYSDAWQGWNYSRETARALLVE